MILTLGTELEPHTFIVLQRLVKSRSETKIWTLSVCSLVRVLSDSSWLQDCQQGAVHWYILPAVLPVLLPAALSGTTSGCPSGTTSGCTSGITCGCGVLFQSEKGISMYSFCETSCPPRTVHCVQLGEHPLRERWTHRHDQFYCLEQPWKCQRTLKLLDQIFHAPSYRLAALKRIDHFW